MDMAREELEPQEYGLGAERGAWVDSELLTEMGGFGGWSSAAGRGLCVGMDIF